MAHQKLDHWPYRTNAQDDVYVYELLEAMPPGLTRVQFNKRCQPDVNAGYVLEVEEAARRYFGE